MTTYTSSNRKWLISDKDRQRAEIIMHLKAGVMIGVVATWMGIVYFSGG